MTETSDAMRTAVALRFPLWSREEPPSTREKLDQLEDHVLVTAYWQGELEQERFELYGKLDDLTLEWDHLEGWEPFKRTKTETAVEDAKRQLRPDLYDAIRDQRSRIARVTEQIKRLDRDFDKVSRLYTILTGG